MELGEKLRQARLEAGLSQRQLCGREITRNMLSLIENGSAKPSMKTLQYLAARLGKSVSFFLEETAVTSPNQAVMESARQFYDAGDFSQAWDALKNYRSPDPVYDREREILWVLIRLELARDALQQGKAVYAQEILEQTPVKTTYLEEALNREKLLLLGSIPGQSVSNQLPQLDTELLIRAEEAFNVGEYLRSSQLLEAMEHRDTPRWHFLRGSIHAAQKQWEAAIPLLLSAENHYPGKVRPLLETCFREIQDFRKAYEYACKQRT